MLRLTMEVDMISLRIRQDLTRLVSRPLSVSFKERKGVSEVGLYMLKCM